MIVGRILALFCQIISVLDSSQTQNIQHSTRTNLVGVGGEAGLGDFKNGAKQKEFHMVKTYWSKPYMT